MTMFATVIRTPAQIILAPLAAVMAAVDAAIRRPSLVVAAAVLLVCLPSGIQDVSGGAHVTPADLVAVAAVGVVAIRMIVGDRAATRRAWLPYAAAIASFAIATVTATDVNESLRGFLRYTELFVLIPVAVAMALKDRRDVLIVGGAIVGTSVFEGVVGIVQTLTQTGASYGGQYIRAIGTFGADQVLALGALMGYGVIVTLALGLSLKGRARIALVAAGAFLLLPLGASLSRGAWIATALAVLVMLAVFSWRLAAGITATAIFVVAVLSLGASSGGGSGTFDERITSIVSSNSEPDRSVKDRYALWDTALGIWADNPVFGIGLKDFAQYRDTYAPLSLSAGSDVDDPSAGFRREPLLSAHNQYLMVLAEQGTVGALAFGGLLTTLMVTSLRKRKTATAAAPEGDLGRFFDLAAPGIMVWTLIDFSYGDVGAGPTSVMLAILLGLVARRMLLVPATTSPAVKSDGAK